MWLAHVFDVFGFIFLGEQQKVKSSWVSERSENSPRKSVPRNRRWDFFVFSALVLETSLCVSDLQFWCKNRMDLIPIIFLKTRSLQLWTSFKTSLKKNPNHHSQTCIFQPQPRSKTSSDWCKTHLCVCFCERRDGERIFIPRPLVVRAGRFSFFRIFQCYHDNLSFFSPSTNI